MIMLSVNKYSFMSFFPICVHFISFSCLIAFARTSSMMLKRNGEEGFPYFVLDFSGASGFSPLSLILAVGFL